MKSKEKLKEKDDMIAKLSCEIDSLSKKAEDYKGQNIILDRKICNLEKENQRLARLNEMLTQAICCVYHNGNAILYDEHYPRVIKIVKDGKVVNTEKAESVRFCWDANEFPSLEVTTM